MGKRGVRNRLWVWLKEERGDGERLLCPWPSHLAHTCLYQMINKHGAQNWLSVFWLFLRLWCGWTSWPQVQPAQLCMNVVGLKESWSSRITQSERTSAWRVPESPMQVCSSLFLSLECKSVIHSYRLGRWRWKNLILSLWFRSSSVTWGVFFTSIHESLLITRIRGQCCQFITQRWLLFKQ